MRLLLLLLVGAMGAGVSAWGLPRGGRAARLGALVGIGALVAVTAAAFLLRPTRLTDTGQPLTGLFDAHLVSTLYLRLVVGLWGLESVILVFIAWLLGGLPRCAALLPATLAAMTGGTVAMASADLAVGAAAAAATGLAALPVVLAAEGPAAAAAGARELRVSLVTGAGLLVALAVVPLVARLAFIASGIGSDEATEAASSVAGPVMGIATLAVGLAVAARWGLLPLHVRVSRLTDLVPPETLPLLLAWSAVPLTVVAFAAVDRLIAPLALPLDGEQAVLVLVAVATLAGAALAALFHDDLRHAAGYLVIADAGLVLLAIAALDPAAWGPGRAWVVALAASKTAVLAWAAVVEDRFETRSLPDLRGWVRRSPLLASGLVLAGVATFGLPGWVALDARLGLAEAVAGSPWRELLIVAGFLTLPAYLRLLAIGAGRVTSRVDRAAPERFGRRRPRQEVLPVEQEGGVSPDAADRLPLGTRASATAASAVARVRGAATGTRGAVTGVTATARGAASRRVTRNGTTGPVAAPDVEAAGGEETPAGAPPAATGRPRAAGRGRGDGASWPARARAAGQRATAVLRRDRTELLSGAVLALAILAVLTSWGALDLAEAAAERAPIILDGATD